MSISLKSLVLNCKHSTESVDFASQVTYIHGEIATGKSSIARLIDFCLGGDLERTPAIQEELVSVQLSFSTSNYSVVIDREAAGSKQVQVQWSNDTGVSEKRLVPLTKTDTPIFGEDIFSLSELLLYFLKIPNVKVPKSEQANNASPVALSFRDLMWYCYLEQDTLESCFYNLTDNADPFRKRKSRFVMSYIVGLYTEQISELEIELGRVIDQEKKGELEIENVRSFLTQFGFESEIQVIEEINSIREGLRSSKETLDEIHTGYRRDTHFADELREQIRKLDNQITNDDKAVRDTARKIYDQESLKAELISSKYKLSRFESAKGILEGANFEYCPSCGTQVAPNFIVEEKQVHECYLCKQTKQVTNEQKEANRIAKLDIESRIKELEESITRHRLSFESNSRKLSELRQLRKEKDDKLNELLTTYDSEFLSQSLDLQRQIASSEEKMRNLAKISEMPKAVNLLEQQLVTLRLRREKLDRQLKEEKMKRENAEKIIKEIEENYKQALLSISLPEFTSNDTIIINRKTWMPEIIPCDKTKRKYSFENMGSAGVKVLMNVTYALVLHKVAVENNLPLPTLLIIDSPSKNIEKDVNPEICTLLYNYIYSSAVGTLSGTQFILIDNKYFEPPTSLQKIEYFMTKNDKDHPPLIRNYKCL